MYEIRKQSEPLPERCDSAITFDGMRTQFECTLPFGHGHEHRITEDEFSVNWWEGDDADQ